MKLPWWVLSALTGAFIMAACSPKTAPTPPATSEPVVHTTAPVEISAVEILTAPETSTQLRVLARGSLPTPCAALLEPVVESSSSQFEINLSYELVKSEVCTQQTVDFEKSIPLDLSGLPDGDYTISINGVSAIYSLETASEESAIPKPTPIPLAAPTEGIPVTAPESNVDPETQPTGRGCSDVAAFFGDVTIPDNTSFQQNTPFTKTWAIRNEGTCSWDASYSLVFAGGDVMNGALSVPLQATNPGEVMEISVDLISPAQGGVYTGNYEFENPEGVRFGVNSSGIDKIWVAISVSWYQPGSEEPKAGLPPEQVSGSCSYSENSAYISQLENLINQARADAGLAPLQVDGRLSAAATKHSLDMGCQKYLDHTGSDGSKYGQRVKAQGYTYSYVSENIYAGSPEFGGDAQGAFDWWMNSTVHRNNILSNKVTQIGIGYVNVAGSPYGGYYTLNFARP